MKVFGVTPMKVPLPSGTFGVRSPSKYGSTRRPPAPAGDLLTAESILWCVHLKSRRIISVATVTFIVQRSGNQRLVESQKAAISPFGSMTGFSAQA